MSGEATARRLPAQISAGGAPALQLRRRALTLRGAIGDLIF